MRIMVVGATGFVGRGLLRRARMRGVDVVGVARSTQPVACDLAVPASVERAVIATAPDVVINAAYSRGPVMDAVTRRGPAVLAQAATAAGAHMVHLSTDVVFASSPRWRREDEAAAASSIYGRAKRDAEELVATVLMSATMVRTSLVYGDAANPGHQEKLVRDAAAAPGTIRFFVDERRAPIHVDDLCDAVLDLADAREPGLWHVAGPEAVDRLSLATAISAALGLTCAPEGADAPADPERPREVLLDSARFVERFGWTPRSISEVLAAG